MLNRLIIWLDAALLYSKRPKQTLPWATGEVETKARLVALRAFDGRALAGDILVSLKAAQKEGVRKGGKLFLNLRALRHSNFDPEFYLKQDPLQGGAPQDLIRHFATEGSKTLDPDPYFNTGFYLTAHPDVANAGIIPYVHFLSSGYVEGRRFEPSNFGTGRPEGYLRVEDWRTVTWPARNGDDGKEGRTLYNKRPDDVVISAMQVAELFANKWKLFAKRPDLSGALGDFSGEIDPVDVPDVSIIIPVYGQIAYTLNCIQSLASHRSKYKFQIVIGDDASPDKTQEFLENLRGVNYIRHDENMGFVRNCNATVAATQSEYIVLLNNDTRVVDGWLDALIDGLRDLPAAGMVGSKVYFPDGRLQEAGGIVWRDGSAWNYGRNDDPNRPRYCHARIVDYVSGCSLALRRDTWDILGGFDDHYAPAYYEDTDLAFRIRSIGKRVWMTPFSRVIHYEGVSSGTDTSSGVKAYQIENHRKFFERWKAVLETHRENGVEPWLERNRSFKKVVLILDATTPHPKRDAGSAATVALMRAYMSLGYQVIFLPEDNFLFDSEATVSLQAMGVECIYAPYESSLGEIIGRFAPYLTVLQLIRPTSAGRALSVIQKNKLSLRTIYLNADLHYLRIERQAHVEGRADLLDEAAYMKRLEMDIVQSVDGTFVHSSVERDLIIDFDPSTRVEVLPLVSEKIAVEANFAKRSDVVFIGSFGHPPNVDAALWLIKEIWPLFAQVVPQARLVIVGSNPPESVRALQSDRVRVTGYVDDLFQVFQHAKASIAPLRYGAGAKGKIVTSMAYGVPVVATGLALEGMPAEISRFGQAADSPEELATALATIFGADDATWRRLSDAAIEMVDRYHSPAALEKALQDMLEQVVEYGGP